MGRKVAQRKHECVRTWFLLDLVCLPLLSMWFHIAHYSHFTALSLATRIAPQKPLTNSVPHGCFVGKKLGGTEMDSHLGCLLCLPSRVREVFRYLKAPLGQLAKMGHSHGSWQKPRVHLYAASQASWCRFPSTAALWPSREMALPFMTQTQKSHCINALTKYRL